MNLDEAKVAEYRERMLAEVRAERVRELVERVRVDYAEVLRRLGG